MKLSYSIALIGLLILGILATSGCGGSGSSGGASITTTTSTTTSSATTSSTLSLSAPTIYRPLNNKNILAPLPGQSINFYWESVPSAISYEVQFSSDSSFSSITSVVTVSATNYSMDSSNALSTGKYYWRVSGSSDGINFGEWSRTNNVVIGRISGDINKDGYSDIAIGAPYNSTNNGIVYVYYGSASGPSQTISLSRTGSSQERFGHSVALADFNGDGFSDLIVGAPYASDGGTSRGVVYVFYGNGSGVSASADLTLQGNNTDSAFFGLSVSSAGDVNGDGTEDIIVGAPGKNYARVFFGGTDSNWQFSGNSGSNFGASVSGAGDVNNDGYDDFLIGAPYDQSNDGKANLYYGGISNPVNPAAIFTFAGSAGQMGYSVSSAGDLNRDGYADIIVGAIMMLNEGAAAIYLGGATQSTDITTLILGDQLNCQLGESVSGAGDVNRDDFDDIIIGIPDEDSGGLSGNGACVVFLGTTEVDNLTNTLPFMTAFGSQTGEIFGATVTGIVDVNGDGYYDVMAGAPWFESSTGSVEVFLGGTTMSSTPHKNYLGAHTFDSFGQGLGGGRR